MNLKAPGYEQYSADETLNFMLNRLSWDIAHERLEDIGKKVSTMSDFVDVMLTEAKKAESQESYLEAGFFYRAAEFFMTQDHELKVMVYDKFMEYFYKETPNAADQYCLVDYKDGKLGTIDIPAVGEERDVILFCSGFDGLIEELYSVGVMLFQSGYRVILFEGPGQGAALRRYGLPMTHDWEVPVAVILDHYRVKSCTLAGISLGGYLAPRAAAFESRVKRVIIWGAMQDFSEALKSGMGGGLKADLNFMLVKLGFKKLINKATQKIAARDSKAEWGLKHGVHTTGQETAYDFLRHTLDYHLHDVAKNITQDVLILQGENDHLVPVEQLHVQAESLKNAKSVTARLVTAKEHGAEHCQIGNPDLVINQILLWLEGLDRRDSLDDISAIAS